MTRVARCVFALIFSMAVPCAAAETRPPNAKTISITWADAIDVTTLNDSITRLRISADDAVSVRVLRFNYLHYGLKLTVEERTIESYVLMDKLWSQVFTVASALPFEAGDPFDGAIVAWRRALATADAELATFVKAYAGRTALSADDERVIVERAPSLGRQPLEQLEALRRAALDRTATSDEFDVYERVLAQHAAVLARLTAFVKAADLVAHGQIFPLGRRRAGTVLTFTLTPVDYSDARAGQPFSASYFVRSTRPLVLHVGYSASRLKDLQFDTVRSASGSDLFLATKSDATTQGLVTFMSYEVYSLGPTSEIGLQLTMGTELWKPGETFFAGGGLRFTRFVLSAGIAGRGVREGTDPVTDAVAGAAGVRELFAQVRTRQDWAPFAALSIRVY